MKKGSESRFSLAHHGLASEARSTMSLQDKIEAAISRRSGVRLPETNVRRLVNGPGDDLDGIIIDDFAGRWLISIKEGGYAPKLPVELGYRSLYAKALSKNEKNPPSHLEGEQLTERFSVRRTWSFLLGRFPKRVFARLIS